MKYKLSPSTLNLLEECPRCFWLRIKKKQNRPSGPFPSLPSGMDNILKTHFDKFMEKDQLPPELKELKNCKLFKDKEKLKEWRSNFKGIQYKHKDILLRGAVDNILVKNNKLIVLDYKTRGYPLKEDTHEHYILQMDLYNYLLRKNNYKTEDYSLLLFYYPKELTKTGKVIFNTKLIKIPVNTKKAENIFKKAIKTLKSKIPKPSKDCEFCKYQNQ